LIPDTNLWLTVLGELNYKIKVWMVNEKNEAVFGDGVADLLDEIDKRHSIVEASKFLGMSYRYALHRIVLAEKRLKQSLVKRSRGGTKGGGFSEVTAYGKELVTNYRRAQTELERAIKTLPKS